MEAGSDSAFSFLVFTVFPGWPGGNVHDQVLSSSIRTLMGQGPSDVSSRALAVISHQAAANHGYASLGA
jgi:hypothetical protein